MGGTGPRTRDRGLVLGEELGAQPQLVLLLGEQEERQPDADEHGAKSGEVGVLVTVEERRLGRGGDLGGVLRVLRGQVLRAGIGDLELALGRGRDVLPGRR